MMKKHLKKILGGVMSLAVLVSGISVNAAATMKVNWRGDYSAMSNPQLVLEIQSPALYRQQVTVVVYDADIANPTFSDYIRIAEVAVNGNDKATVTFNVTDSKFIEGDNHYKVVVQGNGYMANESTAEKDVYIMASTAANSLLRDINGATEGTITSVIEGAADELQITPETNDARDREMATLLVGMRTNENGGSFANLEKVKASWAASDIIVAMAENEPAATIEDMLTNYDAVIGLIDSEKEYMYEDYEDGETALSVAECIIYNKDEINTVSGLTDLFRQSLGIVVMNNSTSSNAPSNLDNYLSCFNIDSAVLEKYNTKISSTQRAQVAGAMYQKNIKTPSEFVNKFQTAVNSLKETTTTPTPSPTTNPSGNGPGGAGITGPSAGAQPTTAPTAAPTQAPDSNTSASGFKDVTKTHWADNYIAELSQKGIINGYDDNTFRPSNNVTREEFVKMIITGTGLYDANAECEFDDVPSSAWSYKYLASAYKNDIVSGVTDTSFGVGTNITRQDVAVIAARILTRLGKTTTAGETTLTDIDTVTDYAQESVKILNSMGIINGFDDGSFMPHNALTRAEAAAIISKLIAIL